MCLVCSIWVGCFIARPLLRIYFAAPHGGTLKQRTKICSRTLRAGCALVATTSCMQHFLHLTTFWHTKQNAYSSSHSSPTLFPTKFTYNDLTINLNVFSVCLSLSPLQCLYPELNSKPPLTYMRQPLITARVHMVRSGSGMCQAWRIWAICSEVSQASIATYRIGTCQVWSACEACSTVQPHSISTSRSGTCQVWSTW